MAESLSNETLIKVNRKSQKAELTRLQVNPSDVVRGVIIGVDASPSDTTIMEVPAGQTFWMTKVTAYTNNAGHLLRDFYDSAGDSASGSSKAAVLFTNQAVTGAHSETYGNGIPFIHGITMNASDLVANKTFGLIIHGYMV